VGVDAVAFVSMVAALAPGQGLADAIVAVTHEAALCSRGSRQVQVHCGAVRLGMSANGMVRPRSPSPR
jgi:hypothetical protein